MATQEAGKLINEAIKRILLDIVIRGHGDRLIGRWSREPEIQEFLEQVPYMLDRINQLHLACSRADHLDTEHLHSHHPRTDGSTVGSLSDFLALVGHDMHWLVRTRDPLGLTPLHKAVLHLNRPVVEYIVDRYQGELVASAYDDRRMDTRRLIDAQDKYGRTALHYAAAISSTKGPKESTCRRASLAAHIFNFLVTRGASLQLRDFRGKLAGHYVRHAGHLSPKSIVHLSAKLTANFQAQVLSKTLRAASERPPPSALRVCHEMLGQALDVATKEPDEQSDSHALSLSCSDLPHQTEKPTLLGQSRRSSDLGPTVHHVPVQSAEPPVKTGSTPEVDGERPSKWLAGERLARPVMSQSSKLRLKRCLEEGVVAKVTELLVEGYGEALVETAATSCWNQQCRRYVSQLIPRLLKKVDELHEAVADASLGRALELLAEEPNLARIRRPYRRGSLNCLHLATWLNRRQLVERLAGRYPELVGARDSQGATCLHWAAKSLSHEPLYLWLVERHGQQLELVRDSRGKLAADYRQQVIRALSNSGNGPQGGGAKMLARARKPVASDAHEFLQRAKLQSDKLQLTAKKSIITNRKASKISARRRQPSDSCQDSGPLMTGMRSESEDLDDKEVAFRALQEADENFSSSLQISPQETEQPDEQATEPGQQASSGRPESALPVVDREDEDEDKDQRAQLLGQMAKIQSSDLQSGSSSAQSQSSRAGSALLGSSERRFLSLVQDSIRRQDLNKLEHLVLAGCGGRLVDTLASCADLVDQTSDRVRRFLRDKIPELVGAVDEIHRVLHRCVSNSDDPSLDLNASFHKLSNLMIRSSLIMARDPHGASSLHVALLRCDSRLASYLLRRYPDAASGPDRRGRVASHYAALMIAARRHHGDFRLSPSCAPSGYWPVDASAETISAQLESRFPQLADNRDGLGLTAKDLSQLVASRQHDESLQLDACCHEFAELINLYGYRAYRVEAAPEDEPREEGGPTAGEPEPGPELNVTSLEAEPPVVVQPTAARQTLGCLRRSESCDGTRCPLVAGGRRSEGRQRGNREPAARSRTADELLQHLDHELQLPGGQLALLSARRQVAPKPTVGSSAEFHQAPVGVRQPTDELPGGRRLQVSLLRRQGPSPGPSSHQCRTPRQSRHHKRRHRRHHHHHHHHHHHCGRHNCNSPALDQQQALQEQLPAHHQTLVGGVIVPTIIHDDKMDEIETYDIIYRAPPAALSTSPSIRQPEGSSSGSSTDSSGSGDELAGSSLGSRSLSPMSELEQEIGELESERRLSRAGDRRSRCSSDGHQPTADEQSDDERVERLSSEFNGRVTKERQELRQKVDQLMAELQGAGQLASGKLEATEAPLKRASRASLDSAGRSSARTSSSSSSSASGSATGSACRLVRPQSEPPPTKPVAKNALGQTYLHFIVSRMQRASTLFKILDRGSRLLAERDLYYRTPRDVALQFNLANNVQILDKFVIDLFIGRDMDTLSHLLKEGYSPLIHVADPDGNDIMLILKLLKLDQMIHFLLQMADFQRWRDELHTFIRHGYSAGVSELVGRHHNLVRAKSVHARTSLHLAVLFDRPEMVSQLLAADPTSVHLTDNMGRQSLRYAHGMSLKSGPRMRAKLIAHGAHAEARDLRQCTPRYYAAFSQEVDDIRRIEPELN